MAGYWPSCFFFWSIKTQKKNKANIPGGGGGDGGAHRKFLRNP